MAKKTKIKIFLIAIFMFSFVSCSTYFNTFNTAISALNRNKILGNNPVPILVDKDLFFPFGFYASSFNPTQRNKVLQEIADAGFNTMFVFWSNIDKYEAFLDEAERIGMKIITELRGPGQLPIVQDYKNKSAVLGWGIADDAGDHWSSEKILEFHRQVKKVAPNNFTYISVSNWSKKWAKYSHVADLIGGQSYPIGYPFNNRPKNLPNDLIEVNYVFDMAHKAVYPHKRPVIANLQAFNWKNNRLPTSKEVYNMTYQALLNRVSGILYYTYDDGKNLIRQHPEIWNTLKSLIPEVKKLSPVILKGNSTTLNTNYRDVLGGEFSYGRDDYIILINTSPDNSRQLNINIPIKRGVSPYLKPLFANRSSGIVIKNRKLTGEIKAQDVHVYQLLGT
jgi:hypothetical protein